MYRDDPFSDFRKDDVTLVKQSGDRVEGIKAMVKPAENLIRVLAEDAVIEDGDTLLRHLPNGVTEDYLVLNSGYKEKPGGLPAEYYAQVEKRTALKPSSSPHNAVYNVTISGPGSRFNLNSNDLSVNVIDVNPDQLFKELRGAIAQEVEDDDKRGLLLRHVGELKKANGTPKAYTAFVSIVADHLAVVPPFIPALSQLLQNTGR